MALLLSLFGAITVQKNTRDAALYPDQLDDKFTKKDLSE
jgi:hypothetical protein